MLTDLLKSSTQENHQRLEGKLVRQMKAIQSTQDYIQLLTGFYTFFSPLEKQITSVISSSVIPDIDDRRKTELLKNDLTTLGYVSQDNARQQAMTIGSLPEAIGILYVMEGSTLGGPFIAQLIKKQLPDTPTAYSFFEGYGNQTQAKWESFRSIINNLPLSTDEQNVALLKANETFEKMYNWF